MQRGLRRQNRIAVFKKRSTGTKRFCIQSGRIGRMLRLLCFGVRQFASFRVWRTRERSAMITVSTPGPTGLPCLRERISFLHGAEREREKVSDGFHHRLEFHVLDVGLVLRAKRCPLPFLVYVKATGRPARV